MGRIEIVSASAGSGKTYRLTTVLDEALATGTARPDAVIATTFTVKAAAELKERARSRLLADQRFEDAARLAAARIGTVNAVCGRLVSDFAFELGLSPDLRVLDETTAALALRQVLSRVVTAEDTAVLTEVTQRLDRRWRWQEEVERVVALARANGVAPEHFETCGRRSLEGLLALFGAPEADGVPLDAAFAAGLARFLAAVDTSTDTTKATAEVVKRAQQVHARLRRGLSVAWADWLWLATRDVGKRSRGHLAALRAATPAHDRHPRLHADLREAVTRVFAIAARAMHAYTEHKRAWGALDFTDQEVWALALLGRDDVQRRLRGEIDLVLVDEFQDTSPLQLAIFLRLAALAERSVWVGDQKQAIFGFRGTDPALMDAAVQAILGGAEPDTLDRSWRSRPELVRLTSDVFALGFAAHGIPAARVRLTPAPDHEPAGLGPVVERWRLAGKNRTDEVAALAEAVRAFLADPAVRVRERAGGAARPVQPGDVAVLCYANETCAELARALAVLGVRAVLPRTGLLATPEARLVLNGLRLFVDPTDTLAATELARLVAFPADGEAWLTALLTPPHAAAFGDLAVAARVAAARATRPHAGTLAAFDAVVDAVEARERCLEWGASADRLANLDALRAHAVAYAEVCAAEGAGATPAGLVAALIDLAAADADHQAMVAGADAVVVSTWHSAKGLEWPVAVLFDLDRETRASALGVQAVTDRTGLDLAHPLADRWIRFWPQPYHPRQTKAAFHQRLASAVASTAARELEERQALRLLYVGWTRARDRVVLAGRAGKLGVGMLGLLRDGGGALITEPDARPRWAGRAVDVRVREAAPSAPASPPPVAGLGYDPRGPHDHPPAFVTPSAVTLPGAVGAPETIGARLALRGDPDPASLGEAVHGFLAADRPTLAAAERLALAGGLLERWGVAGALAPTDLLAASEALRRWIEGRWPGAAWRREWPLLHRLGNGTVVRGAADLVLEHADGLVVIDHKSFPGTPSEAVERAGTFAGQLAAYAAAVSAARARPVTACFVHLPVSALVVPVALPP